MRCGHIVFRPARAGVAPENRYAGRVGLRRDTSAPRQEKKRNYGTNDTLHNSNPNDTNAAINQALAALRASAPNAQIIVVIPFAN